MGKEGRGRRKGGSGRYKKNRGHGGEQNGVEAEGLQARRPAGRLVGWEGVWAEDDRGAAPDVLPLEAMVTAAPEGPLKKGAPPTPPRVWRRTTTPPPPTPRPGRHSDDASWRDGRDASTTAKPPRDAPQRTQPRARVVRGTEGPMAAAAYGSQTTSRRGSRGRGAQVGGAGMPSLRARRPRRVSRPEGQRGGPPTARSDGGSALARAQPVSCLRRGGVASAATAIG